MDPPAEGPDDMVRIPSMRSCIDRYEASEGPDGEALSVVGVEPWTNASLMIARAACAAAGKHVCTPSEWGNACIGEEELPYPYGETYDPELCNSAELGEGAPQPTGSMPGCEGGLPGLFDLSGNMSELLDYHSPCPDYFCQFAGSSYLSEGEEGMQCGAFTLGGEDTSRPELGFRCCLYL